MKHCILFLWLGLAACEHPGTTPAPAPAPAEPARAQVVEVVRVAALKLDTTVRLNGELVPYEEVAIYPRVSGFVEEVQVDRGSEVKKGQLLARLSAPELDFQRAEVASKVFAARSTFKRIRAAAQTPGAVAKNDLDVSEASVHAEEERLRSLKALEGYLIIRAPFDGVITERNVHPGALVGPPSGAAGTPMLRLETVKRLRLTVAVPESDLGTILEGAEAKFSVRTWPGELFTGVIRRIARSVDVRTRTMPVELDVDNTPGRLSAGTFAEVIWPVHRAAPSLVVPPSAIVQSTDKTYVDRVREDLIEQVAVRRGAVLKDRVEVLGSLQEGDVVLVRGNDELKDGTHVTPREVDKSSRGNP